MSASFAAYELVGVGKDGEKKLFRKPWMMATVRIDVIRNISVSIIILLEEGQIVLSLLVQTFASLLTKGEKAKF